MAQREPNLPEGTDQVIPGAMDTDTSDVTGGAAGGAGSSRGGNRSTEGGSATGTSGDGGGNAILERVRSGSEKLSGQAADKARDFVGQGIERSADAIANVARLVGDTAPGLEERLGTEYADYARRAAETLESTANRLASKDPDELIDDTRNFVRKSPGVALAGAAIIGFALARLVKSGLSAGQSDDEDGDQRDETRSTRNRG